MEIDPRCDPAGWCYLSFAAIALSSCDCLIWLYGGAFLNSGRLLVLAACACYGFDMAPWLDVPYVRQVKAGCGAAAVSMVVQYWARHTPELKSAADETDRIDELLPASRRGIKGVALKDYLAKRGFDVYVFDGEVKDLRNHFDKGRPIIVCLGPSGPKAPLHYAVVVGIDEESVWLHDSARGKLVHEPLDQFESSWNVSGHWALLAVPRRAE
jgi:ABC-type bacteriocin/lantibiotic exporter with double-glycine peptidase domain